MRTLWLVLASLARAQDDEEGCCAGDLTRDAVESCGTDQLTRGAAATTSTRATPAAQPGAWDIAPSVLIQPGEFRMGTDRPRIFVDGEAPSRRVALSRAFLMDVYEATNDDFAAFVDATGYVTDSERFGWSFVFHLELSEARRAAIDKAVDGVEWWLPVNGSDWRSPQGPGSDVFAAKRGAHPVVQVSWHDAAAYCAWRGGRLPTEAEWEYAARDGRSQTMYPWGNELTPGGGYRANLWQGDFPRSNTADDGFSFAGPVGSYAPQTATGIHDLIGNVWEWVSDWWYEPEASAHDALSEQRVDKTEDVVAEGDAVWVVVTELRGEGKYALSMRLVDQATGELKEPLDEADAAPGRRDGGGGEPPPLYSVHRGVVARIQPFGCRRVGGFPDGLCRVSQMCAYRVEDPKDVVDVGEAVRVKVVEHKDAGKYSLSMKAVDQATGEDLDPTNAGYQPSGGPGGRGRDKILQADVGGASKKKKKKKKDKDKKKSKKKDKKAAKKAKKAAKKEAKKDKKRKRESDGSEKKSKKKKKGS
ncbi:formylglycine-generating oxidase [Aureococcus anophagefferens]|nr:formylglycine-generating oxidase [Aureococcus anophagefferens]